MKKITLLLTLCFTSLFSWAQNDCKDALFNANQHYEAGQIAQAIAVLEPCAANLSPKETKFEAYKLLAISNQDLGNTNEMNKYISLMLHERPYYQLYPNGDPASFTKEVAKFNVSPKLMGGIKVGTNINNIKLVESYSALDELQGYNPAMGFQAGLFGNLALKNNFMVGLDLNFGRSAVDHEIIKQGNWEKNYREHLSFLQAKFSLNKVIPINKNLNIVAGVNIGAIGLQSALVSVRSNNLNTEFFEVNTKDAIDERNKIQTSVGFQVGIDYKLERGRVGLEIGYLSFLNNTVDDTKRLEDKDFIFDTRYVNDDLKLRLTTINLSYAVPLSYLITR